MFRPAILLVATSHVATAAWLKLPSDPSAPAPPARFGHAAAISDGSLVVSHGYKLDKGDSAMSTVSDWRDDTWILHAGSGGETWTRSLPCSGSKGAAAAIPEARFGHSLATLGRETYLFGGDDGGNAQSRTYVRSLRNDVWRLRRCRGAGDNVARNSWTQVAPPPDSTAPEPAPRALQACVTITLPTRGSALREAMLCYGGMMYSESPAQQHGDGVIAAAGRGPWQGGGSHAGHDHRAGSDGDADHSSSTSSRLVDSGELWLMTPSLAQPDVIEWTQLPVSASGGIAPSPHSPSSSSSRHRNGASSGDAVDPLEEARAGRAPIPRHGHSLEYHVRPVAVGSEGGQIAMEHSVLLFGGTALECGTRDNPAYGVLERHEYVLYDRPAGAGSAPAAAHSAPGGADDVIHSGLNSIFAEAPHGGPAVPPSEPVSCALGDTWRLVWHVPIKSPTGGSAAAAGGANAGFQRPVLNNSAAFVIPSGIRWQRLTFAPAAPSAVQPSLPLEFSDGADAAEAAGAVNDLRVAGAKGGKAAAANARLKQTLQSWLTLSQLGNLAAAAGVGAGGAAAAGMGSRHPSPRGHAGLSRSHSGLLLFGGALCAPGCTDVHDDTWIMRISPTAVLTPEAVNAATVPAGDLGISWRRQRPHPMVVTVNTDAAGGPLAAGGVIAGLDGDGLGYAGGRRSVTSQLPFTCAMLINAAASAAASGQSLITAAVAGEIPLDVSTPHKRYRHSLTSHAVDGGLAVDMPPLLFGGESFFPSAYFDDSWLWIEPSDLDVCASEGVVIDINEAPPSTAAGGMGDERTSRNGFGASGSGANIVNRNDDGYLSFSSKRGGSSNSNGRELSSSSSSSLFDRWLRPRSRSGYSSSHGNILTRQPTLATLVALACALALALIVGPLQCCLVCFRQPSRRRRSTFSYSSLFRGSSVGGSRHYGGDSRYDGGRYDNDSDYGSHSSSRTGGGHHSSSKLHHHHHQEQVGYFGSGTPSSGVMRRSSSPMTGDYDGHHHHSHGGVGYSSSASLYHHQHHPVYSTSGGGGSPSAPYQYTYRGGSSSSAVYPRASIHHPRYVVSPSHYPPGHHMVDTHTFQSGGGPGGYASGYSTSRTMLHSPHLPPMHSPLSPHHPSSSPLSPSGNSGPSGPLMFAVARDVGGNVGSGSSAHSSPFLRPLPLGLPQLQHSATQRGEAPPDARDLHRDHFQERERDREREGSASSATSVVGGGGPPLGTGRSYATTASATSAAVGGGLGGSPGRTGMTSSAGWRDDATSARIRQI